MRNVISHSKVSQNPACADACCVVQLEVADQGEKDGIDIRVYDPVTHQLCFEFVAIDPDICPLVRKGPQSDAAFAAFCRAFNHVGTFTRFHIVIQFHDASSVASTADIKGDDRNSRVYRMVEDIADDLLTCRPGSLIEIGMQEMGHKTTSLM